MKNTGWRGGKQFLLFAAQPYTLREIFYLETEVSVVWMSNLYKNEYYHTVVIATEKLLNSEAKPRCYDNFEGDNNHVVIFF